MPAQLTQQWALASQSAVKLGIQQQGWYRVTYDDLVAAGLAAQVDPATLQLFVNGTEQAIRVTTATPGVFTSGDAVEFYGVGADTPYTDTRIYWLQAGVQPGRRIAVAPGAPSVPSASTGFASALKRKDRSVYFAAIRNGDAENWFGPGVFPPDPSDPSWTPTQLTLTPNNIDHAAAAGAQLTVDLQGVRISADGTTPHRVGVLLNGTDVGEMTFLGQAHVRADVPGRRGLACRRREHGDARRARRRRRQQPHRRVTLTYPHSYEADADRLQFTVDAPASIVAGGFAGSSVRVFDITDRTSPVELQAAPATVGGVTSVTVNVAGTGTRTLLAFSDETVASPLFVKANLRHNCTRPATRTTT